MTFILHYLEQSHIENIGLTIFKKLVSLIILLLFFAILKRVTNYLLKKPLTNRLLIQDKVKLAKKHSLSSLTIF